MAVVELANSGVEIKVGHPRRGDNNTVLQASPSSSSKGSAEPMVPPTNRRRSHHHQQQQQRRQPDDCRPFRRWLPWLVPLFVFANIVVFVISMYINNCPENSSSCVGKFLGRFSFESMKTNPLLGPSSSTLEKMGALDVDKVVQKHQAWRLISCIWLHAGVFHILANMLSLVFIGIRLEQEFGFIRIGLVYIISGFGGSLLSALFIQSGISVGASGALFGLLGGMLSELITNWTIYANKLAALFTLVLIIVINLAVGILPHVDNFAHIGGFLSGFFLGFVFLIRPQFGWVNQKACPPGYTAPPAKSKHKTYQYVLLVLSLTILIIGFTVGLVTLLRGTNLNERCSWCHYFSCVPTPLWSCKSQKVYCESSNFGGQFNLTCLSNGKNRVYLLDDSSRVDELCTQLCS
ncbi:RHOMBOID-like protein 1 [Euphorbia lathyris]|uniref:RHOMBOID-like protein 1 n=1 Tax=Euphorbia lathyris TaxID=212925 RepID=UPI003313DDAE